MKADSALNDQADYSNTDRAAAMHNFVLRRTKERQQGLIGEAQYQADIKPENFNAMADMTQGYKLIESQNPAQITAGVEMLKAIPDKNLSMDKLDQRNKMMRAGEGEIRYRQTENYRNLYLPILAIGQQTSSPVEGLSLAEVARKNILNAVNTKAIDPHQGKILLDALKLGHTKPDLEVEAEDWGAIYRIDENSTEEDYKSALSKLHTDMTQLGQSFIPLVKQLEQNRKSGSNKQIADAVDEAIVRIPLPLKAEFRRAELAKCKQEKWDTEQTYAHVAQDAVAYVTSRTPEKVGIGEVPIAENVTQAEQLADYYAHHYQLHQDDNDKANIDLPKEDSIPGSKAVRVTKLQLEALRNQSADQRDRFKAMGENQGVRISSKAEWDALPVGARFVWKDGRAGVK
jgi:hypothetical protein